MLNSVSLLSHVRESVSLLSIWPIGKYDSAQSKSAQSTNSMSFSSIQDMETLQRFVRCKPVAETFEDKGDGSLRDLFDGPLMSMMRECAGYKFGQLL